MTLIAAFEVNGLPILFGDILGTYDETPPSILTAPYAGSNVTYAKEAIYIQKTCLINNFLAIAWTGSGAKAQKILSAIKSKFKQRQVSKKKILEFINTLNPTDTNGLGLIGITITRENKPEYFSLNIEPANTEQSEAHKLKYVSGSGKNDFLNALSRCKVGTPLPAHLTVPEKTIIHGLFLASSLTAHEIMTLNTFRNFYGGAFEMVVAIPNEYGRLYLKKYEDYYNLFMDARISADTQISLKPHLFVKPFYTNETLFFQMNIEEGFGMIRAIPLIGNAAPYPSNAINISSTCCLITLLINNGTQKGYHITKLYTGTDYVQFVTNGDTYSLNVTETFEEDMRQLIRENIST